MEIINKNLKFKNNMVPFKNGMPRIIVLHHRGGCGDIESIHQQHLRQGWAGIGYHFYIRQDGKVYSGRPINMVGAHCNGNNSSSIGICLEGDFRRTKPTKEQLQALRELVKNLRVKFPNINKVLNHKDLYKTLCPVVNLKAMI